MGGSVLPRRRPRPSWAMVTPMEGDEPAHRRRTPAAAPPFSPSGRAATRSRPPGHRPGRGVPVPGCETVPVTEQITYLDHAATTPLRPEARAAMLPWLGERFGNPSGDHRVARAARQAVDEARDVVVTSGGTEADNMAVRGVHAARPGPVLCSAIEHDAVRNPVRVVGGETVGVDRRGGPS